MTVINCSFANTDQGIAPYLFADGTRNTFDMAWNADGELFGGDNGPDIDLPDEVNVLRQGKHYGFPWRFGAEANPVLDPAYTATGDTVNLASRLEGQARAGEVVVSETTYAGFAGGADIEELEPLSVKGKSEAVRAFVLRGLA